MNVILRVQNKKIKSFLSCRTLPKSVEDIYESCDNPHTINT